MSKILFFFTASYPFGSGETFIENEMPYLAKVFDKIIIISNNVTDSQTREIPQNVVLERMPYELTKFQKMVSLFGIFNKLFWQELTIIKNIYNQPITKLKILTSLQTLRKGIILGKSISSLIINNSSLLDEVYVYSYWTNDIAFTNTYITKPQQIKKVISRAHGWDVYFEANAAKYLPYRKYILDKSHGIYFISDEGKNYYLNLFPELSNKIAISRLGVTQQFNFPQKLNNNELTLISCSNVIPLKRVNLIIEALALIENIRITWLHFGKGYLLEDMRQLCKDKLDKKANITYELKGSVSNKEILAFYSTNYVDSFINVSSTEGIPVSIMEAFSFKIPCIATDVGGNSEIITHSSNGILLSSSPKIEDIAQAIKMMYNLPKEQIALMKESAYETWKEKYNAEKNFSNFITLFD